TPRGYPATPERRSRTAGATSQSQRPNARTTAAPQQWARRTDRASNLLASPDAPVVQCGQMRVNRRSRAGRAVARASGPETDAARSARVSVQIRRDRARV